MIVLLCFYTEDTEVVCQFNPETDIPKRVHMHTIDCEKKLQILYLPFRVEGDKVIATIPANTIRIFDSSVDLEIEKK